MSEVELVDFVAAVVREVVVDFVVVRVVVVEVPQRAVVEI